MRRKLIIVVMSLLLPLVAPASTCRESRGIDCTEKCEQGETKETRSTCIRYRGALCLTWVPVCYCAKMVEC